LEKTDEHEIFQKSIDTRDGHEPFVFYEGPPSANGMPGIHHVMARTIKDIFCRYRTLKGFQVKRKAGWDTHGLPIELGVEKELGITKEDIGKTISIAEYNDACRKAVMKYTDVWNDLTRKIGYWVDMDNPYVTYDNKYIESVWWLLKKLFDQGLLYKGYTIQPYSPKAGTGLSSHELNQPGTYRDVKDTTVVAQFRVPTLNEGALQLSDSGRSIWSNVDLSKEDLYLLAWTTTPWTLPSNTALAVGAKISYVLVRTFNQYTFKREVVILAKDVLDKWFKPENAELDIDEYSDGDKKIPFEVIDEFLGMELTQYVQAYEPVLKYAEPDGRAYKVINGDFVSTEYEPLFDYYAKDKKLENRENGWKIYFGDFVTTEDGTGIVHIAPTFGADDARVAKVAGIGAMLLDDGEGNQVPLVDLQGRFRAEVTDYAGEYVKAEYYSEEEIEAEKNKQGRDNYLSVDERIAIKLKEENKAFRVERYVHSYPHCWRTDKPILYYPMDSWFVRTTEAKDRLIELNKTINWKPESTGTGRFGNWLENLQDWNLSRSRFWGIPLPIWSTEDKKERTCIGSSEDLKNACQKAVEAGLMETNPLADFQPGNMDSENYEKFDLHRPYMDDIVLVSESGKPMHRETDLIDVWFDSGAMPYAQLHYPFENKELVDEKSYFPADFIAEGVDQTRGWFFTLHAIGTMCFDSVAYKNVISNGLVLDKNGQKMSKRLGNAVDAFETLAKYGPDATRWYMTTNAEPWDNLKFDLDGIGESQRKFFGTLYNTYGFYALYANIDGYTFSEDLIPIKDRPEIDRWVMSKLHSLIAEVDEHYEDFEPKKAGRVVQEFVNDHLSNWYVRLCRRRFWKGEPSPDKSSAYQTLYTCLEVVSKLMSPIAPFYADKLFQDLNSVTGRDTSESVHLSNMPEADKDAIDVDLEERMEIAQKATSLILSIRKKERARVRQPLAKVMIPVLNEKFERQLRAVENLIVSEVNVKQIEYLTETAGVIEKTIKPNFKTLGPKYGKQMKLIAAQVGQMGQDEIAQLETSGAFELDVEGQKLPISIEDVDITSKDIPGWSVASEGGITVALDLTITDELEQEGLARELVNRIQNLRKDQGLEVTDRISLTILEEQPIKDAVNNNLKYICAETLAETLELVPVLDVQESVTVELVGDLKTQINITTLN